MRGTNQAIWTQEHGSAAGKEVAQRKWDARDVNKRTKEVRGQSLG